MYKFKNDIGIYLLFYSHIFKVSLTVQAYECILIKRQMSTTNHAVIHCQMNCQNLNRLVSFNFRESLVILNNTV